MKKIALFNSNIPIIISFALMLSLFISGCEAYYKTPYPISESGETPLNKNLLGHWVKINKVKENDTLVLPHRELSFYQWDDHTFIVQDKHIRSTELLYTEVAKPWKIWNSIIDSIEYINCQYIGEDTVNFIYRLDLENEYLRIRYLKDTIKFIPENCADLRNYIHQNQDSLYKFFTDAYTFIRWEEVMWNDVNPEKIINAYEYILEDYSFKDSVGYDQFTSLENIDTLINYKDEYGQIFKIENLDSLINELSLFHLYNQNNHSENDDAGIDPDEEEYFRLIFLETEDGKMDIIQFWHYNLFMDVENDLIYLKRSN